MTVFIGPLTYLAAYIIWTTWVTVTKVVELVVDGVANKLTIPPDIEASIEPNIGDVPNIMVPYSTVCTLVPSCDAIILVA